MAKLLKLRRGTTTQHGSFTGAEGEVTIDTTKDTAVVHDGQLAGGRPLAREDMSNVSSASIVGQITNTALAGVKVQPNFGSQNIETTGTITSNDITISDTNPKINFTDSDHNPDFSIQANSGVLAITDETNNANRLVVNSDGHVDLLAGLDVTGNITATGNVDIVGQIEVGSVGTFLKDNQLRSNAGGNMFIDHGTGNQDIVFRTSNSGPLDTSGVVIKANGNVDFANGIDVIGNITLSGQIDGRDIAADGQKLDGYTTASIGELKDGVVATTQAQSDNSTKVSTTAYVRTAIANAQAFPSGTKMLFQQTAAPTGWTKVTSGVDNKALRVVSGTAGSGGSNAFSNTLADRSITANADNTTMTGNVSVANSTAGGNVSVSIGSSSTGGTVNNHTLSTNEMPSHSHGITGGNWGGSTRRAPVNTYLTQYNANTNNTGGGGGHSHGFSGSSHSHNTNASFSGNAHTHNATFTAAAHNHSINVTNLDLAVSYLDVIIASKD